MTCIKIAQFPSRYPDDYNLPYKVNIASYAERGWPFIESCWANLGQTPRQIIAVSRGTEEARQKPPILPDRVEEILPLLTFTRGKTDRPLVLELYREEFTRRFSEVRFLDFRKLGWNDTELIFLPMTSLDQDIAGKSDHCTSVTTLLGMRVLKRWLLLYSTAPSLNLSTSKATRLEQRDVRLLLSPFSFTLVQTF